MSPGHGGRLVRSAILAPLLAAAISSCAAQDIDFKTNIQPVLNASCVPCHHGAKGSGGLAMDSARSLALGGRSGPVIKLGDSADSLLIRRIVSEDTAARMPLGGAPLPPESIALLRAWIDHGAPGLPKLGEPAARHWAYVAPVRPAVPATPNSGWARNPVDAFILTRLQKEGLRPSPEATRETLIRRVSLD